jgi:hypothetical protein
MIDKLINHLIITGPRFFPLTVLDWFLGCRAMFTLGIGKDHCRSEETKYRS